MWVKQEIRLEWLHRQLDHLQHIPSSYKRQHKAQSFITNSLIWEDWLLTSKVSPPLHEHVRVYPKHDLELCSKGWRSDWPSRRSDRRWTGASGLTVVGDGLTARFWVMRELAPIALDRSSGRDPAGKSSPKDCSRSARTSKTSQATAGTKRECNWGLEERIRVKGIKT
jgi:hypothetical protein